MLHASGENGPPLPSVHVSERPVRGGADLQRVHDRATYIFNSIIRHISNDLLAATGHTDSTTSPARAWYWWSLTTHSFWASLASKRRAPSAQEVLAFFDAYRQHNTALAQLDMPWPTALEKERTGEVNVLQRNLTNLHLLDNDAQTVLSTADYTASADAVRARAVPKVWLCLTYT
jgi:hypothetical protein